MAKPVELEARCGNCILYGAIEGMVDAFVLVDLEGRIFQMNRTARDLLEVGSRQVNGARLDEILRHPGLSSFWASALRESAPVAADLSLPSGRSLRATVSSCISAGGEPIGRVLVVRDVTREKKIQVELTDSVARRLVEMADSGGPHVDLPPLTGRQHEILVLLAEGMTNAGIAEKLHVSANTVASHLKNLYPRLKVNSRSQAVAFALAHGVRPRVR
jgi:PAS domain S-box-containing protein